MVQRDTEEVFEMKMPVSQWAMELKDIWAIRHPKAGTTDFLFSAHMGSRAPKPDLLGLMIYDWTD